MVWALVEKYPYTAFCFQRRLVCAQASYVGQFNQCFFPVVLQRLALSIDSLVIDILRCFIRPLFVNGSSWYYHAFRSQFGSRSTSISFLAQHALMYSPCTKGPSTLLPVCSSGCPTTICKNRCNPSLRCSITSSLKRFVNTLPGKGGMVTRADSRSRMSRKYSKSE